MGYIWIAYRGESPLETLTEGLKWGPVGGGNGGVFKFVYVRPLSGHFVKIQRSCLNVRLDASGSCHNCLAIPASSDTAVHQHHGNQSPQTHYPFSTRCLRSLNMAKLTDNRPFLPRVIRSLLTNKCCGLSTVRVDGYVALEITVTTGGGGCQDNQRYLRNA